MPRSIWNGAVSFGAVDVPIKVYSAQQDRSVHFRQVHCPDGAPIEHRRVCSAEDRPVPYEEVVKGYELPSGDFVVLTDEEIAAADHPRRKAVEVEGFVPLAQIDPVFYDRGYYLAPQEGAQGAYRLLVRALEKTELVGLGRVVLRRREQMVALRPVDGVLRMHTMRFADELVTADELEIGEPERAPSEREVDMARRLLESLETDWDPTRHRDTHRKRVLELVERKAAGEEVETRPAEAEAPPDDLTAALEAMLADAGDGKGKGKRGNRAKGGGKGKGGGGKGKGGGGKGKGEGKAKAGKGKS